MGIKKIFLFCLLTLALFADNIEKTAKNHAEFYKKALPLRTNDNLILTDILAIKHILIYRYSVNDTFLKPISKYKDDETAAYIKNLEKIALKNSCLDKVVLNLLKSGVVIEHIFYFERTKLLFEIQVDRVKCDGFNL